MYPHLPFRAVSSPWEDTARLKRDFYGYDIVFLRFIWYVVCMKGFYNRRYAVDRLLPCPQTQRTAVGIFIRRTIGKGLRNTGTPTLPIRTFRVRRGNGYYGSKLGELIQDQYDYFVPSSINNPEGQDARDDFAAAVAAWKALPDPDKKYWNDEAVRLNLHMSGMNLYIRKWRLGLL